jgi:hypothetical protein
MAVDPGGLRVVRTGEMAEPMLHGEIWHREGMKRLDTSHQMGIMILTLM